MMSFRSAFIPAPYSMAVALGCSGYIRKSLIGYYGAEQSGSLSLCAQSLIAAQKLGEQAIAIVPASFNLETLSAMGVNTGKKSLLVLKPDTLQEALNLVRSFTPMVEIGALVALDIDYFKPSGNDIKAFLTIVETSHAIGAISATSPEVFKANQSHFHAIIKTKKTQDLTNDTDEITGWRSMGNVLHNTLPTDDKAQIFQIAFNRHGVMFEEFDLLSAALGIGLLEVESNGAIGRNGIKFASNLDHAIQRLTESHIKGRLISAINEQVPMTLI